MTDTSWKVWERKVCRDFGGERHWEAPEECKNTGAWAPEAKYRQSLPNWLEDMMVQAENQARDDQLPLVALTEKGRQRNNALVIVRYGDFLEWFVSWHNNEPPDEDELPDAPSTDGQL